MKFKVLASSSKGNCYTLTYNDKVLLLECGISIKEIKMGTDFRINNIIGCLITHEHHDHSKAVKDLMHLGIRTYLSAGTAEALQLNEGNQRHMYKAIQSKVQFDLYPFRVMPFDTEHDAAEPLGFLIVNVETGEKLIFATDTYYIKYRFSEVNYYFIECNYDIEILNRNAELGFIPKAMKERLLYSHFNLGNVKKFFQSADMSCCADIVLLHLSDSNSDAESFRLSIEQQTGKNVYIADSGLEMHLDNYKDL